MTLPVKHAVVTGGNGAIGRAIALALADAGCAVTLIDACDSHEVGNAMIAAGHRATAIIADLGNPGAAKAAIARAVDAMGGLDVLVNAAGVVSTGSFANLAEAEWERVLATNLTAVFTCCQAAIAPLRRCGGGRIINIGSVLAKNGGNARPWLNPTEQDGAGNVAYAVAKAGVHTLTTYLARLQPRRLHQGLLGHRKRLHGRGRGNAGDRYQRSGPPLGAGQRNIPHCPSVGGNHGGHRNRPCCRRAHRRAQGPPDHVWSCRSAGRSGVHRLMTLWCPAQTRHPRHCKIEKLRHVHRPYH